MMIQQFLQSIQAADWSAAQRLELDRFQDITYGVLAPGFLAATISAQISQALGAALVKGWEAGAPHIGLARVSATCIKDRHGNGVIVLYGLEEPAVRRSLAILRDATHKLGLSDFPSGWLYERGESQNELYDQAVDLLRDRVLGSMTPDARRASARIRAGRLMEELNTLRVSIRATKRKHGAAIKQALDKAGVPTNTLLEILTHGDDAMRKRFDADGTVAAALRRLIDASSREVTLKVQIQALLTLMDPNHAAAFSKRHGIRPAPGRTTDLVGAYGTETHDFGDGAGPVPAHRHPNGGGWVADTAQVEPACFVGVEAVVCHRAKVRGQVRMIGRARAEGQSVVEGSVVLRDNVRVREHAHVVGLVEAGGWADVHGQACVRERARLSGHVRVGGTAVVEGDAQLLGQVLLLDNARVGGQIVLNGEQVIGGDRVINTSNAAPYVGQRLGVG